MTKDVLLLKLEQGKLTHKEAIKFFESNVCIPKGANRHPYADVLHEWVEGTKIECRYLANDSFEWKENVTLPSKDYEYRIKPSEPVYEWQWINTYKDSAKLSKSFLTEDEAYENWEFKLEETKRERK